jgi:acetoacetate decarboxylase
MMMGNKNLYAIRNIMIKSIKTHVQYKSLELYSIGTRNYFSYNGISYSVTTKKLKELLAEMEDISNPLTAANYLLKQKDKQGFTKITK